MKFYTAAAVLGVILTLGMASSGEDKPAIKGRVLLFGTEQPVASVSVRAYDTAPEGGDCAAAGGDQKPVAATDTSSEGWYLLEAPEAKDLCVTYQRGSLKLVPAPEQRRHAFAIPMRDVETAYMLDPFATDPEAEGLIVSRGIQDLAQASEDSRTLRLWWDELFRVGYRTQGKVHVAKSLEGGQLLEYRGFVDFRNTKPEDVNSLEPIVWDAVKNRELGVLPRAREGEGDERWLVPRVVLLDIATSYVLRSPQSNKAKVEALQWISAWDAADKESMARALADVPGGR